MVGKCCTTHDPWIVQCCTTHGPWAFDSVVQCCMTHGSWEVVTLHDPMGHGKKLLNSVAHQVFLLTYLCICPLITLWCRSTLLSGTISNLKMRLWDSLTWRQTLLLGCAAKPLSSHSSEKCKWLYLETRMSRPLSVLFSHGGQCTISPTGGSGNFMPS